MAEQRSSGVIWCPGCDSTLRWAFDDDDHKVLDDESWAHVTKDHGYAGPRTLREHS